MCEIFDVMLKINCYIAMCVIFDVMLKYVVHVYVFDGLKQKRLSPVC